MEKKKLTIEETYEIMSYPVYLQPTLYRLAQEGHSIPEAGKELLRYTKGLT